TPAENNGDGRDDLVVVRASGELETYVNTSQGERFVLRERLDAGSRLALYPAADINGDGLADLFDGASVRFSVVGGGYTAPVPLVDANGFVLAAVPGDFDGDRAVELAIFPYVSNDTSPTLRVVSFDSNGNVSSQVAHE